MQTQELRYCLAVARSLNFTKAAAACAVSQPALTRAIKKLEDELGGPLFHRHPTGVELTRLGKALLPQLEEVERNLAAVKRQAGIITKENDNQLRLGVMCTVGPVHIVQLIMRLRERYDDLTVSIANATSDEVVELLLADEIDLGITAMPVLPDSVFELRLFDERFVLAVNEGHPLHDKNEVDLAMLRGVNYLERINCEFDDFYEAQHGNWEIDMNVCFSSEREDWIQALVLSGFGCSIMPESMPCLPGIGKRLLRSPEINRRVSIISQRGRPLSPTSQSFLRLAAAHKWMPQ